MDPSDDAELIRGCLKGNKRSWDAFVDRYSRLVYWSIWKTLESQKVASKEELCREVYQDFFVRAADPARLERFGSAKNIKSYIRAMVSHLVFDRLRQISRQARSEIPMEALDLETSAAGTISDARETLVHEETQSVVRGVVDALSVKEKTCFELCYVDGRTHREIGLLLNMPQDTVSTILRRTKDRLRNALEEKGISG